MQLLQAMMQKKKWYASSRNSYTIKYLGYFWRALNMPLISCEVSLELKWNKNCVITSLKERQVDAGPPVIRDGAPNRCKPSYKRL